MQHGTSGLVTTHHVRRYPSDLYYSKQSFELDGSGLPIAQTAGFEGGVWTVGEFSDTLHHVTAAGNVESFPIPLNAVGDDSPFTRPDSSTPERDWIMTRFPHSERIVADTHGRLWFPQNGHWGNWNLPPELNAYSRVVSFDTRTSSFCTYPVPDNQSNVMGVYWDEDGQRLWFAQSGNDAIVYFYPREFPDCTEINAYVWQFDDQGELVTPLPTRYCAGAKDTGCFHRYAMPQDNLTLNQLVVMQASDPDPGAVWLTLLFQNALARFDPATGELALFPLHRGKTISDFFSEFLRPHPILIHPVSGDLVFAANGMAQVIRFDLRRYLANRASGACETLDRNGRNPCMRAFEAPVDRPAMTTHSIDFDRFGNLWFTTWGAQNACGGNYHAPSIGFVNSDWTDLVYFDHLRVEPYAHRIARNDEPLLYCVDGRDPAWAYKGIVADDNGDIWITNFYQRRVAKLTYRLSPDVNPYCAVGRCGTD